MRNKFLLLNANQRKTMLVFFLFILIDVISLQGLAAVAIIARIFLAIWTPNGVDHHAIRDVQFALLLLPGVYALAGLYPGYGQSGVERLRKRVIMAFCYCAAMIFFDCIAMGGRWSTGILLIASCLTVIFMPIIDALFVALLMRLRFWGEPVAVFGPTDRRDQIVAALTAQPLLGWYLAEIGDFDAVYAPRANTNISVTLLALPTDGAVRSIDVEAMGYGRIIVVPHMAEMPSLGVSVRDLGACVGLEMQYSLQRACNRVIKRTLDVVLGAVLLVPIAPIVLVLALIVKIVSPGPAFFVQSRHGLNQRPFGMIKLRTMVVGAEKVLQELLANSPEARAEWATNMKLRRDPRIIRFVGAMMRRFSLDELPQLWNVVRGDMSLIGPRPLPEYHLATFSAKMRNLRALVRPGVTGLWQVSGRSDLGIDDQQRLDAYYLRNWSLWLDFYILLRTFTAVVRGGGAR
jgi:Undecaprenyl-phosphate galactose phosphotransferase WbaP